MNSFSSASQMCEPLPRTMNRGSPPTERNARTGEFTPPGIMLSALNWRRRDCSVLCEVVDGIESSQHGEIRCQQIERLQATTIAALPPGEFIRYSWFCNLFAIYRQYRGPSRHPSNREGFKG